MHILHTAYFKKFRFRSKNSIILKREITFGTPCREEAGFWIVLLDIRKWHRTLLYLHPRMYVQHPWDHDYVVLWKPEIKLWIIIMDINVRLLSHPTSLDHLTWQWCNQKTVLIGRHKPVSIWIGRQEKKGSVIGTSRAEPQCSAMTPLAR